MELAQPTPLEYERNLPAPTQTWWPFVRIALIVWAGIGVAKFLLAMAGFGYSARGLMFIPSTVDFASCTCLLLGAIAATTSSSRNVALTIGAGGLVIYATLASWFNGSMRGGSVLPAIMSSVQYIWFPIALVVLRLRTPFNGDGDSSLNRLGGSTPLLMAAQIPGVAGMCLLASGVIGLIRFDPFGATALIILILTAGGSITSAALSLALSRRSNRHLSHGLAVAHVLYLLIVAATIGIMIATAKPAYRGPGGF